MAVAEQVKEALGTLPDELRRAHRARLFRRPHLPRGGRHPGGARGHGEESDQVGSGAAPRQPGRTRGGARGSRAMTTPPPEPSHVEIQSLLGAYALDATDPEESAMVELHLQTCVRCATEVAQHHEVAGLLANSGGEAPEHLWDGIASQLEGSMPPSWNRLAARLDEDGPSAPAGSEGGTVVPLLGDPPSAPAGRGRWRARRRCRRGRRRRAGHPGRSPAQPAQHHPGPHPRRAGGAVAAVDRAGSAHRAVRVGVGVTVQAGDRRPHPIGHRLRGRRRPGRAPRRPDLPALGLHPWPGHLARPAGALPGVVPFSVAGQGGPSAFAITAEQAGGVVQPTGTPVVEGDVRT